jgi:hypothetical protein
MRSPRSFLLACARGRLSSQGRLVRREARAFRAFVSLAFALFSWCVLVPSAAAATPPAPRDYDIKAAFLFNFASFVEWPGAAFANASSPFVIGVIGDDPFGSILEEIIAGEKIAGHPLVLRRFNSRQVTEAAGCHILFVSQSESRRLRPLLQQLRGKPVLTVSDIPNFLDAGGAVAFTTEGSVHLTINPRAARTGQLSVSSKLLRLARVVDKEIPSP